MTLHKQKSKISTKAAAGLWVRNPCSGSDQPGLEGLGRPGGLGSSSPPAQGVVFSCFHPEQLQPWPVASMTGSPEKPSKKGEGSV